MHKTRMEKWAQYREVIYNNIELHDEVIASNEKLAMLYKRLLQAFPKYEKIFKNDNEPVVKFSKTNDPNKYDLKDIRKLIDALNLDEVNIDLKYLDEIKFSTGELETIIHDLESWRPKGKMISSYTKHPTDINIKKTKKVKI